MYILNNLRSAFGTQYQASAVHFVHVELEYVATYKAVEEVESCKSKVARKQLRQSLSTYFGLATLNF